MAYLVFLALSCLCVNGVHGYLLISQKSDRKWSISEHAARDTHTFRLFVSAHVLGGAFFLLFAHSFFLERNHSPLLFGLSVQTVVFEYIQAFLPAKGRTNFIHSLAAYIMWVSFIAVGVVSLFVLHLSAFSHVLALLTIALVLAIFLYAHFDKVNVYKYQMAMVLLFYVALGILVA